MQSPLSSRVWCTAILRPESTPRMCTAKTNCVLRAMTPVLKKGHGALSAGSRSTEAGAVSLTAHSQSAHEPQAQRTHWQPLSMAVSS